ncbi:MAG: FAD-dependent oxidoreductase [Candidatus Saccharibacteria bacterium]
MDAYQTKSILMDSSKYMPYLVKMFSELGGTIEQKEVADIKEALEECGVVVNCTGLGSKKLFNDVKLYPVRGQVVLVEPNGFDNVLADDEAFNNLSYIIPRIDDIVVGGTAQKDNWSLEIDPEDTKEILRKAPGMSPVFKDVKIIKEKVGLRPARDEVRLELERVDNDSVIIHNYGHGGAGYTLSWGCANEVIEIINALKN